MTLWRVTSPCTVRCVGPSAQPVPATTAARRLAAVTATVGRAFRDGERLADPLLLRERARSVLGALGVTLETQGVPLPSVAPDGRGTGGSGADGRATGGTGPPGTLIVANHISWLDAVALLAVVPTPLLAKRDVAGWPVLGRLAGRAGTLFLDRDAVRTLPDAVAEIAAVLRSGRNVALFPGATTWCAPPGGAFRRATFQAAVDAGAPVQPVSLGYRQFGAPSTVPAYVGAASFGTSLRRVARASGLSVTVRAHPPFASDGLTRRELAARAQASVRGALEAPAPTRLRVPV
ncbi:lysophospholipid acyltransferase family protein [Streptomyces sp. GSL17-111]|uniref:lysophospholipid acyltransferase family protein n=1 Tax=Streptomyces sp. GSL17-111 TaxID=3121596 RepID=UPI0030F37254